MPEFKVKAEPETLIGGDAMSTTIKIRIVFTMTAGVLVVGRKSIALTVRVLIIEQTHQVVSKLANYCCVQLSSLRKCWQDNRSDNGWSFLSKEDGNEFMDKACTTSMCTLFDVMRDVSIEYITVEKCEIK
ncbi:hypothetical protein [Alphabaculovirus myunipunctae]|uniref:Uncharacterized protein n=1 Tax=Mythimna unipuncta nucleopolyhedrovirus TaxID=447897 RepID=A0A2K9VSE6_9ABAC|nr:hypothetical protein [Mythimna unipuncta nucleopolyhedrovirus]AUV65388.1 hypothetical protein [Mythimna unipuncta nucleopolyhedrovirus]